MRIRLLSMPAILGAAALLAPTLNAHNPCCNVTSIGVPGAVITLNGTAEAGEWTGAGTPVTIGPMPYMAGGPPSGSVTMLHKADGLYFLAVINDSTVNDSDAFNIRFDMNNNGGATTDADDFGVAFLRGGQATWGLMSANQNTWATVPASDFGFTSSAGTWIVEFHLPTGPPSNFTLSLGTIGVYFNIYDADQAFGNPSAKYSQWPTTALVGDANADDVLDQIPNDWANLILDPKTTFPDVQVITEHLYNVSSSFYYSPSFQGTNQFEVEVANPGGTVINDAANVQIYLYLAARGIGESWHRMDTNAQLTADCALATWPSQIVPQSAVCSGTTPLPDITTTTINDIVNNVAKYTIQGGVSKEAADINPVTILGSTDTFYPILDWALPSAQDKYFTQVTVNGTSYDRLHECMMAEAIFPGDPNPSNNFAQVNMNFTGVPSTHFIKFPFSLGWPGFSKYDPNAGKAMYLQVGTRNMDERVQFQLEGMQPFQKNAYVANLKGRQSLAVNANIKASSPDIFGKTIKENLVVPPKAGGTMLQPRSGVPPVWVRVPDNSTIWIVNYSLSDTDKQWVDVDGRGPLPPTGPAGLPPTHVKPDKRRLLVPSARLGELVLSFDGFKTGVGIAEGVQLKVPGGVNYIALAINNYAGAYGYATGTGFRVKIILRAATERDPDLPAAEIMRMAMARPSLLEAAPERAAAPVAPAAAAQPASVVVSQRYNVLPIFNVIPQVCVAGYEDIGQKRPIKGTPYELFRYIGNVCWGITNVVQDKAPPSDKADQAPNLPNG